MTAATALDAILDPVSHCLDVESARRIAEVRVAPEVQERLDYLADRANEGLLTGEKDSEYAALIDAADILSILKAKARQQIQTV